MFHLNDRSELAFSPVVPKDSLQSMAVPGSNTGKYTQPYSQSLPRKKLFSPSELKLPTTDTVLFYEHFSVLLPELFWSLLKSFTATVPWERTIGEAEAAPPVPRQGGGQRQDLARGLQGQSQSSGWFTAPQAGHGTLCQLLGWCQGWWLQRRGGAGPGCCSWGCCGWHQRGCAEVWFSPAPRWEAAARREETLCSFERHSCTAGKTLHSDALRDYGPVELPHHREGSCSL